MTLHEAIKKVLQLKGGPMTTNQIADALNKNGWYQKKDGSKIQAFQIHGRTRNYTNIFNRQGTLVSLKGPGKSHAHPEKKPNAKSSIASNPFKSKTIKTSFDPISNVDTTILILGTMPGDKSLELGEYYAHPRNRFWKIIATITEEDFPLTYADKKELLLKSKIGIWDVAHKVRREGSLDSAIEDELPNDLAGFFNNHKNLKIIGFNGTKAQAIYDKFFERQPDLEYILLPSTSPANTRVNFDSICSEWKPIFI